MALHEDVLLPLLRSLELELHKSATRQSVARLSALLADDFAEFGRSGHRYTKASVLERLPAEETTPALEAFDFELRRLGPTAMHLTYRSANRQGDGTLTRHTLRSSIWRDTGFGWQMSFHQGTATSPEDAD